MNIPVYVSITSIYERQEVLYQCLQGILQQSLLPKKVYLYLSEDKSLFDNGFVNKKLTFKPLEYLLKKNDIFKVFWGNDIGPYGKLLPLLKKKWKEDCLIITLDDDTVYNLKLIKNMVEDYKKNKCVICYRGFTPDITNIEEMTYLKRKVPAIPKYIYNFPTGKGGILYHPTFFHKTNDLIFNEKIYNKICKTADDVWFHIIRIVNGVDCFLDNKTWILIDNHAHGLSSINNKSDCLHNDIQIQNVIKKIKELGYL